MRELYVNKEHTLTDEELLDITSIGRSLPGTMIGNIAMFFGHRIAGFWGGVACMFGMITVPMIIAAAMKGVRAAVAPVILSALMGMVRSAFKFPPCFAVAVAMFALYFYLRVSPVILVVIGAVLGLLICEYYERRKNDAAA